jgi:hypothetical protein
MQFPKCVLKAVLAVPTLIVLAGSGMNHSGATQALNSHLSELQQAPLYAVQREIATVWEKRDPVTFESDLKALEAKAALIEADISAHPVGNHPLMLVPVLSAYVESTPTVAFGAYEMFVNKQQSFGNIAATLFFAIALIPNLLLLLSITAFIKVTFTPTKQSMV